MEPRDSSGWTGMTEAEWRMRVLLALQGIDVSLERIANSKQSLAERLSSDDESA